MGVNMATFVGYAKGGVFSAVLATLSLVLPSIIVICIIARMLEKFQQNRMVQDAFAFIRPAVTGLIAAAGWSVFEIALFHGGSASVSTINWLAVAIFAVVFAGTQWKPLKKLHPVVFILLGAVLGVVFSM